VAAEPDARAFSGTGIMRLTMEVEASTVGTWTIRAGHVTGLDSRPRGVRDAFAVAFFDDRILVAVASTAAAAHEDSVARAWVDDVLKRARGWLRSANAGTLAREVTKGHPGDAGDSLLVLLMPGRTPAGDWCTGTMALIGTRVSTWVVTDNSALPVGPDRGDGETNRIMIHDGEVLCAGTTAAIAGCSRPAPPQPSDAEQAPAGSASHPARQAQAANRQTRLESTHQTPRTGRTVTDVTSHWWHPAVAPVSRVYDIRYTPNPRTTARDRKAGAR
jgi:hypothetical protein